VRPPRRASVLAAVLAALACAALLAAARDLDRLPATSLDLSRAPLARLAPAWKERLARLDSDLLLTYAASPEASMPRELRGVAAQVTGLLRSIERAAPDRVRVQVLDPESDPALPGYLAGVGLAPFRSRALLFDAPVERSVWSGLRIAYGPHGSAAIRSVTPEVLDGLQPLILAHLELLESPRRPRVAVAAPESFRALRRGLRARAEVIECDFETGAEVPADADLLFWIEPRAAGPRHAAALRALLARGGSAVVAGSELAAELSPHAVTFARTPFPTGLYRELGLAPVEGIAFDAASKGPAALLRSIGTQQDFRALGRPPNGTLLFAAPTAFEPDPERLAELGLSMTALASAPETTRIRPWTPDPVLEEALRDPGDAARAPRLPLLALLAPDRNGDPWRGSLVVAAASSPFSDEYLRPGPFAHEELLSTLVASLASPDRLAAEAAGPPGSPRVPELSATARDAWRAAVVLLVPALLAIPLLARGRRPGVRVRARRLRPAPLLALALALLLAGAAPRALSVDLTRGGAHGLAVETRALLARCSAGTERIGIERVFSPDADLPPGLRAGARSLRELTAALARASTAVEVRARSTRRLDSAGLADLARDGVLPLDAASPAFASLIVRRGAAVETLSFPEPSSFEHAEFRIAGAIERSLGARRARIAVGAGAPRLTPAEALEYQRQGLFAPGGADRFGEARALLEENDFLVRSLEAEKPEVPPGTDALVCLQPRRNAEPLIAAAAQELARGGRVLIAAQHFSVRSRRLKGAGMALALWPDPQYDDLDRFYFGAAGIGFPREVVLDDLHAALDVATQVEDERGSFRIARERAASPLFVRAVPEGFDRSSPVLRGIGELVLPCPTRIAWDEAKLAASGLSARALVSTSRRTRTFAWKGGDLPPGLLDGQGGEPTGPVQVAALFEGTFPPPSIDPSLHAPPATEPEGTKRGRLLLLGCSDVFRDGEVSAPDRDNAQLLLGSVASLALPADLAAILARRSVPPALGLVSPSARVLWRVLATAAGPVLVLAAAFAASRRRRERRPA
jgi:hypothetical protein